MKKKITTIVLLIALLTIVIGGATLAYFTDSKEAVNTFTVGNVKIDLTEDSWVAPANAAPGIAYNKDPNVKNIGLNPAYIRIKVTISDAAAFGNALSKHKPIDPFALFTNFNKANWINAKHEDGDGDTLVYSADYYKILVPTEETGAVFTSIKIPAVFDNFDMESLGKDFTITITAEAIQSEGFANSAEAFVAYDKK